MLTISSTGITGALGRTRIHCKWASNTGGLKPGEYRLLPARDPVYGIVVFVVPSGQQADIPDPLRHPPKVFLTPPAARQSTAQVGMPTTRLNAAQPRPELLPKVVVQTVKVDRNAGQPVAVITTKPIPGINTLPAVSGLSSLVEALPPDGTLAKVV